MATVGLRPAAAIGGPSILLCRRQPPYPRILILIVAGHTAAFEALLAALDEREACRRMVGLLALAHDQNCEAALGEHLELLLAAGELPDPDDLRQTLPARSGGAAAGQRARRLAR